MAYKTSELEKKSLDAIRKNNLFFIEDVVSFLPCGKGTFYEHKLNESDSIKEALEKNKTDIKVGLRKKWYSSDNATIQIALYRLICTDDERRALSMQEIKHSGAIVLPITGIVIMKDDSTVKTSEQAGTGSGILD